MPWPRCAGGPRPGQRRIVRQETRLVTGPAGSRWLASSFIPNGLADSPSLPGSAIPRSCALQCREAPVRIGTQPSFPLTCSSVLVRRGHRRSVPDGLPHNRRAGDMLFRAKAVAFRSPHHGDTSTTVGGTRSCRAARSARHPVKVEVAGSNPVRTAGIPGEVSLGSQPGQVAQSV
jgi:hypothetical protein